MMSHVSYGNDSFKADCHFVCRTLSLIFWDLPCLTTAAENVFLINILPISVFLHMSICVVYSYFRVDCDSSTIWLVHCSSIINIIDSNENFNIKEDGHLYQFLSYIWGVWLVETMISTNQMTKMCGTKYSDKSYFARTNILTAFP